MKFSIMYAHILSVLIILSLALAVPSLSAKGEQPGSSPPAMPKIESSLAELIEAWESSPEEMVGLAERLDMTLQNQQVLLSVRATNTESASDVAQAIENAGGSIQSRYKEHVDAYLPVDAIKDIADRDDVMYLHRPASPIRDLGNAPPGNSG